MTGRRRRRSRLTERDQARPAVGLPAPEDRRRLRINLVRFFFAACFGLIFLRLLNIQVRSADRFQEYAERINYTRPLAVPAPRGIIYDRNGRPLALSVLSYDIFAEPRFLKDDPETTARKIAPPAGLPEAGLRTRLSTNRPFIFLKRGVGYAERKAVMNLNLPGIGSRESYRRVYPEGKTAGHVVGFVEDASQRGLEGIELHYNQLLAGEEGQLSRLRDGRGRVIGYGEVGKPAKPGKDIFLTIDLHLQRILEEELERAFTEFRPLAACGIVMDTDTGEIMAMANLPDYDPNHRGDYPTAFRRNRSITDTYEPGSVFKIITAAGALEEGLVHPDDTVFCELGRYFVRNRYLHDAHPYGDLSFHDVIVKSSNIGTVKIAMRLGAEGLYRYASGFGFGARTGIDLPGEEGGVLRPVAEWSGTSITAIPIGHEVGATALQSVSALATIVNDGLTLRPHLLLNHPREQATDGAPGEPGNPRRVISPETSGIMTDILCDVTGPRGTARQAGIPGYQVGGKTGTAQKVSGGRYSHTKYLASFAGFIRHPEKNLAVIITIDEPQGAYYGGLVAGPVFQRVGRRIMLALDIPPEHNDENPRPD